MIWLIILRDLCPMVTPWRLNNGQKMDEAKLSRHAPRRYFPEPVGCEFLSDFLDSAPVLHASQYVSLT